MSTPTMMCLGCVPIVDNERTNAYVRWAVDEGRMGAECCTSTDMTWCNDDSPANAFTNPVDDLACWYDPDVPESADFLGLFINDLTGLEDDPYSRGQSDISGIGTVFNRPVRPGKTLTFDVVLLATSCCGMEYGRNWLAGVLKGSGCVHGLSKFDDLCGTTELRIRVCCPLPGASDSGVRNFPYSSLTQGLTRADGDRKDKCCCSYQRYSFVITTGTPDGFGDIVQVCTTEVDPTPENAFCALCIEDTPVLPDPCDNDPLDCRLDDVAAFASPALRLDCGFCPPAEVVRNCCCIDQFQVGSTDRTLVIDLFSGHDPSNIPFSTTGARNVEILIWENPMKLPCPTTQKQFEHFYYEVPFCARVTVGYVPPNSILRIDGRTGEAYVLCRGRRIPIYESVDGDLKKLDLGCNPLLVCSLWDRIQSVHASAPAPAVPSRMDVSVVRKFS
jgi:hypothetical protein